MKILNNLKNTLFFFPIYLYIFIFIYLEIYILRISIYVSFSGHYFISINNVLENFSKITIGKIFSKDIRKYLFNNTLL